MSVFLNNVTKSYDNTFALKNFSAEIKGTGVTAFFGQSGSGKTTILKMLLGLTSPDSGTVEGLAGKKVSAVFQEDRLLEWATALENVLLVMKKRNKDKAFSLLKQVFLSGSENKKVSELSGGMKRRVAIARALAVESQLLILDEPFSGLDDELKLNIMKLIKACSKRQAVVLVSHDIDEIKYFDSVVYNVKHYSNLK